ARSRASWSRAAPARSPASSSLPPASPSWCAVPTPSCSASRGTASRSSSTCRADRWAPPPSTRTSPSSHRRASSPARSPTRFPCASAPAVAEVLLGIETSCDETSAAVLVGGGRNASPELASLIILSQDIHKVFGGVVPELASRAHLAALPAVVERALAEAGVSWSAVDAVAVTQGPGLVGALLVGVVYAKALAYAGDRRLIGVNHLEGHLFAPAVEDPELAPPFVALLVSGGHTL